MTKTEINYDYSGIDRVAGIPTVGQLIVFQKQLAKIQTSYKCSIIEAGDHGWSWIMCTEDQWQLKRNITKIVQPPTHPGLYTGNTNAQKSKYKQELKLFDEYVEHKRNSIKAIQACFDEDLLIDLESDGIVIGYTPMEIYQHIWDNFLLPVDKDREILRAKEQLKVEYNPDRIVQHYYKQVNDAHLLLTALKETVTDEEIKRNAYSMFEKTHRLEGSLQGVEQNQ